MLLTGVTAMTTDVHVQMYIAIAFEMCWMICRHHMNGQRLMLVLDHHTIVHIAISCTCFVAGFVIVFYAQSLQILQAAGVGVVGGGGGGGRGMENIFIKSDNCCNGMIALKSATPSRNKTV